MEQDCIFSGVHDIYTSVHAEQEDDLILVVLAVHMCSENR